MPISDTPNLDAEELLTLARKGNHEAFGQVLGVYRGCVRLMAGLQIGRRLQGMVDRSDVVQETLFQAHRAVQSVSWQHRGRPDRLAATDPGIQASGPGSALLRSSRGSGGKQTVRRVTAGGNRRTRYRGASGPGSENVERETRPH